MRNVKIESNKNWHAVDLKYKFDSRVTLDNKQVISADGLSLNINKTLSNSVDVVNNNYTHMMMSDLSKTKDLIDIDISHTRYPEQFTTSLVFDSFPTFSSNSKFLKVLPRNDDSNDRDIIFGSTTIDNVEHDSHYFIVDENDDNNIYFNVTLIDKDTLTISHNDNFANVYLTLNNSGQFSLETAPLDIPSDQQKFNYIINETNGFLIITKIIDGDIKYIGSTGNDLAIITPDQIQPNYPHASVIRILPYTKSTSSLKLSNSWVSYKTSGDINNLKINESKSYSDVTTNYVFTNQYVSVTGNEMNVDLLQLKNQLTTNYESGRGNPFPNYNECDHREYDRLFTGTNQIKGLDDIHLGYNSYTTDIILEPDTITYFHTPQIMYPYDKININDSLLIECGAIGGDSPITSDKMFKKAADYKYNSAFGAPTDEETGIWLCTWLRSAVDSPWDSETNYSENILVSYKNKVYKSIVKNTNKKPSTNRTVWVEQPDQKPVWVDRYYNPERYSAQQALEVTEQYSKYISKFEYITETLSAEDVYVFDKISDLTFEPGSLYAYYRTGAEINKTTIESMQRDLIHQGQSPVYTQDRNTFLNTTESLKLDGSLYIETNILNKTVDSDYAISFNMSMDDWTKPIGGQIIGNYTNEGVGFFNKMNTTPYVIIPTASGTKLYNTNMDEVLTISTSAISAVHGIGNENIHLLKGTVGDYTIDQYDMTGMLVESTPLSNITQEIVSINLDEQSLYILDSDHDIYKFNIFNERIDTLNKPQPGYVIGLSGIPSVNTFVDVFDDYQYRVNCDTYTMDISGNIWYLKNNNVYKFTQSIRPGVNATYNNTINGIAVSLIADERVNGSEGNSIVITGDGQSSLNYLIQEWNNNNGGNQLRIISGDDSRSLILAADQQLQLTGGVNAGSPTINFALSANPGDIITGLKSDEYNNIWTTVRSGEQTFIHKMDNDRNILFTSSLSSIDNTLQYSMSGNIYMDIVSEFVEGVYNNDVIILCQNPGDDNIKYLRISNEGKHKQTTEKTLTGLNQININNLHNITNYETVKRICNDTLNVNHLIFKIRLSSYFDSDKTYTQLLKYDLTNLTPGYHHFATTFNSVNGNMTLFVDGNLQQAITSDDIYTGAAYKTSKTIHNPILFGTEPYFNNTLFSDHLKIPGYSFITDCEFNNIRIYNQALNFNKIRALTRENKTIQPINLTLPTGKRCYIDQVKRVYRHKKPDRKSTQFNIDIISKTLSGDDIKKQIEASVLDDIKKDLPVNSSVNKINWIQ